MLNVKKTVKCHREGLVLAERWYSDVLCADEGLLLVNLLEC